MFGDMHTASALHQCLRPTCMENGQLHCSVLFGSRLCFRLDSHTHNLHNTNTISMFHIIFTFRSLAPRKTRSTSVGRHPIRHYPGIYLASSSSEKSMCLQGCSCYMKTSDSSVIVTQHPQIFVHKIIK